MHKTLIVSLAALTALAAPLAAQRGGAAPPRSGSVTFAVLVSDPSGAPIGDVKVTMTGPAERTSRTEGGRLVFENLPAGTYTFRFEKDGFVPFEKEVAGRGVTPINLKVTLTALPPPPKVEAPPPVAPPPPPPPPPSDAKPVVLDMPAFIEKNYVKPRPGKTTPLGCADHGSGMLIQINDTDREPRARRRRRVRVRDRRAGQGQARCPRRIARRRRLPVDPARPPARVHAWVEEAAGDDFDPRRGRLRRLVAARWTASSAVRWHNARVPLAPGTRIGPYEITNLLGAGGMGEVYRARDTRLDRDVAIKVLPPAVARDPQALERFSREARTMASVSHPRICAVYDVGEHEGSPYIVMELLEGKPLYALLEPRAPGRAADRMGRCSWPTRSRRRTRAASSTATSSPPTSSSTPAAT